MIEPPATAAATSDSADNLSALLTRSAEFYEALHAVLGDRLEVKTLRDLLTQCGFHASRPLIPTHAGPAFHAMPG
jgi:hypothetical protein